MALEALSPDDGPRSGILAILVRDTPQAFWEDMRARSRQTYLDVYKQVENDPNILAEQRLDSLYQQRHFRMRYYGFHGSNGVRAIRPSTCNA